MLINQLQQLSKAATPGPWRVGNGGHSHGTEFEIETAEQDALYLASVHWGDARVESYAPAHHTAEANAALIVALVNNLPAILTALTAASKLEVAKKALEMIANHLRDESGPYESDYYGCRTIARQALAALEPKP
jgi:hypothetical protein